MPVELCQRRPLRDEAAQPGSESAGDPGACAEFRDPYRNPAAPVMASAPVASAIQRSSVAPSRGLPFTVKGSPSITGRRPRNSNEAIGRSG